MEVSALPEGTVMASPPPLDTEEEPGPAGPEPGDPRAKPPVKPKPRVLPAKPALPAKPSLLVPVGPRPPRGPLAELPSARKMNMLAGPQPYGGSKRALPFTSRPVAEATTAEAAQEPRKEEPGKEEPPPSTPPARCAAPGGVRKAPAPFRLASERCTATTVEEILAKMEQPRKEVLPSPDRLWGSRLSFSQDGSSRYGPRTALTRGWSQEGPTEALAPAECQEEHSKTPKARGPSSDLAVNGDLAQLATSKPPTDVSAKAWVPSSLGCPADVTGPVPGSPQLPSLPESSPQHAQLPGAQSPVASEASLCRPVTPPSPSTARTTAAEGLCQPPSMGLPSVVASEVPGPSSPPLELVSGHPSPKQPPDSLPQPLIKEGEVLELTRMFLSGEEVAPKGDPNVRPTSLANRRFSEGVLRPPSQDQEKLGGSLAALPQAQGSQLALDCPFGSGTESSWSLSQSFEWSFPTRPSGLGARHLDSPPPSPITEASEAAEAAEAGNCAVSQQGEVARTPPGDAERPVFWVQAEDPGVSLSPEPLSTSEAPPLLQAEEGLEPREPPPGQEAPLPPVTREAALSLLEPVLGQRQPAPPNQPCVLFANGPSPGQALPVEEVVTLARAETTQPTTGAQDWRPASPEPAGPGGSSRWLDELLASPPPPKDRPSPSVRPEGLLGWAQKDLQSEFGIAADPYSSSMGPSGWSHVAPQDYSHGGARPGGAPGLGDGDWARECGLGAREGSGREWAEVGSSQALSDVCAPEQLKAHDQVVGKPALLGTPRWEASAQEQELGKRDSRDTFSSWNLEVHDQELGKRDSQDMFSSRDAELQDQELGKVDFRDTFSSQDVELQDQELGKRDFRDTFSSLHAELQDQELGQRDFRDTFSSRDAELRDQELGNRDFRDTFSSWDAELQDQEFRKRDPRDTFSSLHAELELRDQESGKRDPRDMFSSLHAELELRDQESGKRDSRDTFSNLHAELQDREFGKRDSLGMCASREHSLPDWDFGARDCLGACAHQATEEQACESGNEEPHGYSRQDAEEQDREFEKRDSACGAFDCLAAAQWDQELRPSTWMQEYGDSDRVQDGGFGPQVAQQQQEEEFEKNPSDQDGWAAGRPEERGSGGLLSPSSPRLQGDQGSGPGGDTSQEVARPAGPGDGDLGKRGWAGELSLGVALQPEVAFTPGLRDWREDSRLEPAARSSQFGIIGDDRGSGVGPSAPSKTGGDHFVSPGETVAGPVDWTDQLGLRNLDLSGCGSSGDLAEAREVALGQMGWLDHLGVRDSGLASCSEVRRSGECVGVSVGEQDWTVGSGVQSLAGVGETRGHGPARESGVGQTDWSGVEAGEFLRSRECGVGQADWTPDLGLGNMAPGVGCSPGEPRELVVGSVGWGDDLGLRNLEVPCGLESGGARGCGVGQMDWAHDGGLQTEGLPGAPSEAREHGVGEAGPGFRSHRNSPPGLEPRESGVGETIGPESQGEGGTSPSLETHAADSGMELGEASGCGARCPARSPPPGTWDLPEGPLVAPRESAASGLSVLSEQEGAAAGGDQGEPVEPSGDTLPARRPQPDGEASCVEEVDGTWGLAGPGHGEQDQTLTPRRPHPGPPASGPSQDFSFIEDTEVLDSAMYRSRAHLGRKRGHRAPAIRPGGTLGLAEAADSDARLFKDSSEPRVSRVPSSDEEVVEEPQSRRTRVSLGTKGLKVSLFPGLSPSALKAKLRSRNRSAEEVEPAEGKAGQKEAAVQRSKSCKVPGLGKPLALPPKPEKSSGSEGSSPNWLQALKLKKKKV
ncbi:182 kDa tankyrase-1-binding protein isoform 1-T2 [Erethizon dorsatum]